MPLFTHGRWTSRLAKFFAATLVAVVVLAVVGWFFGGPIVAKVVKEKLQTLVAQQLNARLDVGELKYRWPYGVEVHNAALYSTTPGEPSIKLVGFDRLDLMLAKFPLRSGPLIIQRVDVTRPTAYVIETKENGFIGLKHLLRNPDEKKSDKEAPPKLSEVLRLRHLQLSDARVEYDDRTIRKSVPLVWEKLNVGLDSIRNDKNPASYHFEGGAGNGDLAKVKVVGNIDVDELVLNLEHLDLTAQVAPGLIASPLPAGVQRVLNTLGVKGGGHATITGYIPMLQIRNMQLNGDFVIDDAQGRLSPDGHPLSDLNITGRIGMKGRDVTVDVKHFSFTRGPIGVSIQPATVFYPLATDRWTVTPIRAAAAYVPRVGVTGALNQRATVLVRAELNELIERDQFRIKIDNSIISLPDTIGDVTLFGSLRYDDDGIAIEGVQVDGLGGPAKLAGQLNETVSAFAGQLTLDGVELGKINHLIDPTTERSLQGKVKADVKAAATDSLDAIRGEGRFHITGGQFGKVPLLGGLAAKLNVGKNAFIAHDVTGRFTLDAKKLAFTRFAVSTDVLAAVGLGDVYYDGKLDLSVYADGHWRQGEKKDEFYIPLLSDIGRAIAGTGEYIFGSVSRQFTHFTVTGTVDQPKIAASPAPVVKESFDKLFKPEEQ